MGISIQRKVPVYITLSGETFNDYEHAKDEEIIREFQTYYNVRRKDFNIISVYDEKVK
ncbi:MAG: hypothetical protein AB7V16_07385 [Vulcanibacillus sp.]